MHLLSLISLNPPLYEHKKRPSYYANTLLKVYIGLFNRQTAHFTKSSFFCNVFQENLSFKVVIFDFLENEDFFLLKSVESLELDHSILLHEIPTKSICVVI